MKLSQRKGKLRKLIKEVTLRMKLVILQKEGLGKMKGKSWTSIKI